MYYSLYFYSEYLSQDILNAYVNRKMMKNYLPCIGTKMNIKAQGTEQSAKIEHIYVGSHSIDDEEVVATQWGKALSSQ